jgi:hypothetical protein
MVYVERSCVWSREEILMATTLKCEMCVQNLVAESALALDISSTTNATIGNVH